jgi:hypothetical protein
MLPAMPVPNPDQADGPTPPRELWLAHSGAGAAADAAYTTLRQVILVGQLRPVDRWAKSNWRDGGDADLAGRLAGELITNAREARIALLRMASSENASVLHERGAV